eukprot:gene4439-20678_t
MTDEILNMMEERRKHKRSEIQYREVDKEIKRKCIEEKEKWLNTMCIEIESNRNTNSRKLHNKIKEIAGKKRNTCSSSGCLKAKDGTIIIEKAEIIKRWEECIEELFDDERGIKRTRKDEDHGEDNLKSEVEFALRKIKRGKAPGPDQVNVEMLDSAWEIGLEKLTELINKVYNTGNIPGDLLNVPLESQKSLGVRLNTVKNCHLQAAHDEERYDEDGDPNNGPVNWVVVETGTYRWLFMNCHSWQIGFLPIKAAKSAPDNRIGPYKDNQHVYSSARQYEMVFKRKYHSDESLNADYKEMRYRRAIR